jgi:hypothetical protein
MNTEAADKVISILRLAMCCTIGTQRPRVVVGRMLIDRRVESQEA